MRARLVTSVVVFVALGMTVLGDGAGNWPQFRGPNASGLAPLSSPPTEFGPDRKVLWKQPLPAGHSSPVIWGGRIFVTAFDSQQKLLEVLCLSTRTGDILWRRPVKTDAIEEVHAVSNPATATPAVDAERVYVYFGSFGLIAFDHSGNEQWSLRLPIPRTTQGSGTSPVLAGELVILNRDASEGGYLIAVDRRSGSTAWKTAYPEPSGMRAESYSTPVIWKGQAVLHRLRFVEGYDLKDGRRVWWVSVFSTGTSTVVATDDLVYAAAWFPLGEADQVRPLPDFATLLRRNDKDGNGRISEDELTPDLQILSRPDMPGVPGATVAVGTMFNMFDPDRDGAISEQEWKDALTRLASLRRDHGVVAVKAQGEGDLTSEIVWREKSAIPEVPSPLLYGNRLYLVRNGGILSCLDALSGKLLYRRRVGTPGPYYASPVAGRGTIYLASADGVIAVIAPGDELEVIARNDLKEEIFATPAIAGNTLYVRTVGHLYAFGETHSPADVKGS